MFGPHQLEMLQMRHGVDDRCQGLVVDARKVIRTEVKDRPKHSTAKFGNGLTVQKPLEEDHPVDIAARDHD